jgi:CDGSH-type Zn-finger protein
VNGHVDPTSITVYPDGPLLVRGSFELRSADGRVIDTDRNVIALCRCGRSRLKPLCDGSHKSARFVDSASADDVSHVLEFAQPAARGMSDGDETEGPSHGEA